jgi:hypothetical protein
MSEMVRKQFYIHKRQQMLLRRLSQARGISEAEIVRRALEREVTGTSTLSIPADRTAWEEIVSFVEARKALDREGSEPYQWNREDAYTERESRFQSPSTE